MLKIITRSGLWPRALFIFGALASTLLPSRAGISYGWTFVVVLVLIAMLAVGYLVPNILGDSEELPDQQSLSFRSFMWIGGFALTFGVGALVVATGGISRPYWIFYFWVLTSVAALTTRFDSVIFGVFATGTFAAAVGLRDQVNAENFNSIVVISLALLLFPVYVNSLIGALLRKREEARAQVESLEDAGAVVKAAFERLASGDLTEATRIEGSEGLAGEVAEAFNITVENLRTLVARVHDSGSALASAASELNDAASVGLSAAQGQAGSMEATRGSLDTLTAQSDEISRVVDSAVERFMDVATGLTEKGQRSVEQSIEEMRQIEESVAEMTERAARLAELSDQIGRIVELIEGIASQTNLLALNAAIEAARAGEAGRGFGVVADEVRKLAERSTEATKEIHSLISEVQEQTKAAVDASSAGSAEVRQGSMLVKHAGRSLSRITDAASETAANIGEVRGLTERQRSASGQVAHEMGMMAVASANAASAADRLFEVSQGLQGLSVNLNEALAHFHLD